ncbi:MAG: CpsD/CapB family tyrosine-protein kinase [Clostridia bacterium]|nr:CpsD/CapB family tyrosine-protein kinase [Clostridia bacterium]
MAFWHKKKESHHSSFSPTETSKTLHKNLEFTATEQYKLLRTNLDFTLPEGEKCPVIGVSSSMRGEGKSTTSVNLSYVLAEKGSRVLLIDGDLRIPSIAKKMEIEGSVGLTDLLMNKKLDMEQFKSTILDTWYILPAGNIPPNPSELLGSHRMEALLKELREIFDYIVIDLPPVNIVSDALSISGLISGMIIVIREGYTEKKELERCIRSLKLSNVNVLGCVMNEAQSGGGSYGRYRKYRYYKYYRSRYYYKHHGYEAYETPTEAKTEGQSEAGKDGKKP